jgi:hypothetical protein
MERIEKQSGENSTLPPTRHSGESGNLRIFSALLLNSRFRRNDGVISGADLVAEGVE